MCCTLKYCVCCLEHEVRVAAPLFISSTRSPLAAGCLKAVISAPFCVCYIAFPLMYAVLLSGSSPAALSRQLHFSVPSATARPLWRPDWRLSCLGSGLQPLALASWPVAVLWRPDWCLFCLRNRQPQGCSCWQVCSLLLQLGRLL